MTSYYLTAEAEEKRIAALVTRLVGEALPSPCGGVTWVPESDFWKLPESMQRVVIAYAAFAAVIDKALGQIANQILGCV